MKRTFAVLVRTVIILAVVGAVGFGGYRLIRHKKQSLAGAPKYGQKPTPVHVVKAEKGTLTVARTYLAVCEPAQQASVSARITAAIDEVACDEGTLVKAGQILIRLDDREIREDIAAVAADIARSKADLAGNEALVESLKQSVAYWQREADRDKTLAEKGDIPDSQAEGTAEKANEYQGRLLAAEQKSRALQHQIDALERRKKQIEVQLSYCTIRSPYDGLVTRRLVDSGDLASPGKTLLVVEDRSALKLAFDVPQKDLDAVHEGLDLRFTVAGQQRLAVLSHLYPSLSADRTVRAECVLKGKKANGLACGSCVPVSVIVRQLKDVVLVPASSLIECPKGQLHVFVVRNGKLEHPAVTVLGRGGDHIAIDGINAGELVVTSTFLGWANLAAGRKVEPTQ